MNHMSLEDLKYYRNVEKLFARESFFKDIGNDMGIIAIVLSKYSAIPHSLREIDIEEVYEKAEIQLLIIFDSMLSQKKLAEDIGFYG